jgi:hypothetical protein
MDPRDKIKVMEQLAAVESLIKIAASSSVDGVISINRINGLNETVVKEKFAKVYTYSVTLKTNPESFAAFMNKLSNDASFYFRVNSVNLKTSPQVDGELKPLALTQLNNNKIDDQKVDQPVASVEELLAGVTVDSNEPQENEVAEKIVEEPVNINAFKSVEQTVVLGLDWIQFKPSYLEK